MNEMNNNIQLFNLREVLSPESVKAKVLVKSWQEAADEVGQLLLSVGKIEQGYIERMKQIVDEIGPYMVVAPGVALLHARPEDGVREPCVGVVTLKKPVKFGHEENDPVDIVIAFGATNKESHIPALKQLAGQLSNVEVLTNIRSADSTDTLYKTFLNLNTITPSSNNS